LVNLQSVLVSGALYKAEQNWITYLKAPTLILISKSKNGLFNEMSLVVSPQPTCNPNQLQNQKQLFLQLALEEEVAGLCFLLLLI
jgi:hypothetical protein